MVEFAGNSSQSISKVALTRFYLNIRIIALDLKWIGRIYKCIWPWRSSYKLPACRLPLQREEDGYRRGGGGNTETRRVKLCNTRLHSAEDSPGEGNFNSAAVATNKNPLINRDVCEIRACQWANVSTPSTALPLDWMLPVRIESGSSEPSTRSLISSGQEWRREMKRIVRERVVNLRRGYDNQAICCPSSLEKHPLIQNNLSALPSLWLKLSGFIV